MCLGCKRVRRLENPALNRMKKDHSRTASHTAFRSPEPPIRSELFSVERLEGLAESLALEHRVAPMRRLGLPLDRRLRENTKVLSATYRTIVEALHSYKTITPAAEWLLDNFHVVEEQVREIRHDLPPGFYRKLPKLAEGPLRGQPRVIGIALAFVAHTDSAFDVEKLTRFVVAYQRVQALTIGELWALAISLRITLVENLRRLAETIGARLTAGQISDTIADRILGTATTEAEPVSSVRATLDRAPWTMAFAVQLARRLRDHDPDATPARRWLDAKLARAGTTTDEIIREEVQRQIATNVTVQNVITSMRLVSMVNWAEFFEGVSTVDAILRTGAAFTQMDFSTRDMYRRAIEALALGSDRTEADVAVRAVAAARQASQTTEPGGREGDVGFYLIAQGRVDFERELGCRVPLKSRLFRLNSQIGVLSYVTMIGVTTAAVLGVVLDLTTHLNVSPWALALLGLAGLVPASDVAVAVVNRIITQGVGALRLPGLEFREGVPAEFRTVVVVPILLSSARTIAAQVQRLEVHHLSSPGDDFLFVLLSDWRDSDTEHRGDDFVLLSAASEAISDLNQRYAPVQGAPRFSLLHRRRIWNASENRWMGWERKRGKLQELNRLLRGASDTTFMPINGVPASLPLDVRYVITLDADTRLPIGAARRLLGKIAHPLNRPRLDPATGLVSEGHGILQPRVTPSLPIGSQGSLFERVFSGPNGLDPYALAVSDVYQDLFEDGSYCGKGIYDIDAFSAALDGRIPENAVLSHDLLEGVLARAGLASDIEVVEEFPSRYDVAAARLHRWVRGDWQLLPWIFGGVTPSANGARATRLPLMGRWKLIDNLRRSLSAPAALLALIIAWTQSPSVALTWTAFIIFTLVLPPLLPVIAGSWPRRGTSLHNHMRGLRSDLGLGLLQSIFLITFLAHQAWLMIDAMARTVFRLLVRRRLLEWVSAAQAETNAKLNRGHLIVQVGASLIFISVIEVLISAFGQSNGWLTAPFVIVWALSPILAYGSSLPPRASGHLRVSASDRRAMRLVARRTWRFFETFVGPEDNMLPPDNFQEDPQPIVAHRTSPTNIGLYLLSVVAAYDFGWCGLLDVVERLEKTLSTVETLERYRGHLYNWYDTRDLRPLDPKYISTVDSGNLAGHLIALRNACDDLVAADFEAQNRLTGVADTLSLLGEALDAAIPGGRAGDPDAGEITLCMAALDDLLGAQPKTPGQVRAQFHQLFNEAERLAGIVALWSMAAPQSRLEARTWANAVRTCACAHLMDFERFHSASELGPNGDTMQGDVVFAVEGPAIHPTSSQRSMVTISEISVRLRGVAARAKALFDAMEFGFLFDEERQLLSIGYRREDSARDSNFYDLLASEARLASFVAIAKGDIPAKHWFRMGRTLTPIDGGSGLISWSGSMFEYLMPSLVMRAPAGSLLDQTNRLIVWRQVKYGAHLKVPWGMSESEYNARDIERTYQYSSFGVPDLGYKRGLSDNVVIAPYASGLGAMVSPKAARLNYDKLTSLGARGAYGWYEALDYTRSRLPEGANYAVIRAFMAHHQAMTLVGLANALHGGRMRVRFHAEPIIQAAELLLQERMPRDVALARPPSEQSEAPPLATVTPAQQRHYNSAHSQAPIVHILSNGRYSAMVTAAGSGYSRCGDIAVTRWREDVSGDGWGAYFFLRDASSGDVWSAGFQPCAVEPDSYSVSFSEDQAKIVRRDGALTTTLEILVSSEDEAEVRRVSITNQGQRTRHIDVTSYCELSLARQADDLAHPAFTNLFVTTEIDPNLGALLATRRQRSPADPLVWVAHLAVVEGDWSDDMQFETDRAKFIGRGRTVRSAAAVFGGQPLSNTSGPVLDPIFSLRRRVNIPPGATARIAFWTVVAASRSAVLALVDKHRDAMAFDRARSLAWTQAQMQLRHLSINIDEAHLFQRLAAYILYSDPGLRPPSEAIARGLCAVSNLWPHGISGDRPIVLVRIDGEDNLDLVRQMLRAKAYWRLKQIPVDLVLLNDRPASYIQDLQVSLEKLVRISRPDFGLAPGDGAPSEVFILRADLLSAKVRDLLNACARAVLFGNRGTLAEQLNRARDPSSARMFPQLLQPAAQAPEAPFVRPKLEFWNGRGGFVDEGRDYLTVLTGDVTTPAPWINVVANPTFGFQVSADGGGFAWSLNSQQNQLTPWSNDPVSDGPGDAIYITDEETGEVWTVTALPIREPNTTYTAQHGQGYSRFKHTSHGVAAELLQFVAVDDPIKIMRLTLTDVSGRARRLSVTGYVGWVLGSARSLTAHYLITEIDPDTHAVLAQNPWNDPYGKCVAFFDLDGRQTSWTCDRKAFLGRDGALDRPLGMAPGMTLSQRSGGGLDPCGVLRTTVKLAPYSAQGVVFSLGQAGSRDAALSLVRKYRDADVDEVFQAVVRHWDAILGGVQVKTPDRAMDILVNRWLPYQTLSCRIWARTGFYQASGAYGFRDQLQDGMALCVARPDLTRAHLLRAAARQFREGDVQHWWLPDSGRGVRTRVSDDRGWLAYAVAHYVQVTGDAAVLGEQVPFLEGPLLKPDEHDAFFQPKVSEQTASLFEHCALALGQSLTTGAHGLPLMGGGDWNDGMNAVGARGRGESVWLGWFLIAALTAFIPLAEDRGDADLALDWRRHAESLRQALEGEAWDGDWYRRAYFDDGAPLGSSDEAQCQIDSIAQSWAVISGAGDASRARRAMAALDDRLIRRDQNLALLFTPPFDRPTEDPGYIKGYPPGVRENGGQYTHAAVWAVMAFAMQGDGDRAGELMAMLNPIRHSNTPLGVERYRVEPYVACADVYSEAPHVGRGGWTWYTGSAGWMYRVALERLLGLRIEGGGLVLDPCIPKNWPGFEIALRFGSAQYEIVVENPNSVNRGVVSVTHDGHLLAPSQLSPIALHDDGATHRLDVVLGDK